jgi:hypothetical protein
MSALFVHLGYPKTATTTFQQHVFPYHPEIAYLGKLIPSFRYTDPALFPLIDGMMTADSLSFAGVEELRDSITHHRTRCDRPVLLLSSESFLHVTATDAGVVAGRIKAAFSPCKILITVREQRSILRSFYGLHGRFGQYIFVTKPETEPLKLPLTMEHWLQLCFRAYHRNFPALLCYDRVVKHYQDLLGQENVGVFLFEELKRDPTRYVENIAEFMCVNAGPMLSLLRGHHEHTGMARAELLWWRITRLLGSPTGGDTIERRINSQWHRWLSHRAPLDDKIPLSWEQRLRELYGPSNRALSEITGLQLDPYGYLA